MDENTNRQNLMVIPAPDSPADDAISAHRANVRNGVLMAMQYETVRALMGNRKSIVSASATGHAAADDIDVFREMRTLVSSEVAELLNSGNGTLTEWDRAKLMNAALRKKYVLDGNRLTGQLLANHRKEQDSSADRAEAA
jgi:DNA-binding transcriptional regulator YiaG